MGGSTSRVVTHNLVARSVIVQLHRTAAPYDTVECDVERTTNTTVTLRFTVAPSAGEYTVMVTGVQEP